MSRLRVLCWLCNGTGKAKITRTDVVLGEYLSGSAVTIIKEVAGEHGLTPADLVSKSRLPRIVEARNDAICRLRLELDMTLQSIGSAFGGRDHSTILHSLRKNGVS